MWRKTAVRRAKDMWPLSPALMRAALLDDRADAGEPQADPEAMRDLFGGDDLADGTHSRFGPRGGQQQPDQQGDAPAGGDVVDGEVVQPQGEGQQQDPAPEAAPPAKQPRTRPRKGDAPQGEARMVDPVGPVAQNDAADEAQRLADAHQADAEAERERAAQAERDAWEQAEAEKALAGQQQPGDAGQGVVPVIEPLAATAKRGEPPAAAQAVASVVPGVTLGAAATNSNRYNPIAPPVPYDGVKDWATFGPAWAAVCKARAVPDHLREKALGMAKAKANHLQTPNAQLPPAFLNRLYRAACQGVFNWSSGGMVREPE